MPQSEQHYDVHVTSHPTYNYSNTKNKTHCLYECQQIHALSQHTNYSQSLVNDTTLIENNCPDQLNTTGQWCYNLNASTLREVCNGILRYETAAYDETTSPTKQQLEQKIRLYSEFASTGCVLFALIMIIILPIMLAITLRKGKKEGKRKKEVYRKLKLVVPKESKTIPIPAPSKQPTIPTPSKQPQLHKRPHQRRASEADTHSYSTVIQGLRANFSNKSRFVVKSTKDRASPPKPAVVDHACPVKKFRDVGSKYTTFDKKLLPEKRPDKAIAK